MAYGGWGIPSEAAATQVSQSGLDPLETQAIGAALQGFGVVSGGLVTAHGATMGVDIAAGTVQAQNGLQQSFAAISNQAIGASDGALDRYDLIVSAFSTGTVSVLAGSNAIPADSSHAGPLWPSAFDPTVYAVLSEIFVQHGTSVIVAGLVTDKRMILPPWNVPSLVFASQNFR